ncbi:50S ribosomal protein L6 [Candidatus Berkelbacteria bacterium RBG_13_40_8]|uniref:Large ribosomal subunit protein uL6 n=1 Tax=Candidatus Berkelbacteria bacterium RBG_13_40_8 TaxID=1797467 RepID=A0A1F5DQC4_9BACT|nr:MAG: 50S ribosomal protein L6 [Candidatus Berkelbacteria bacterium RBG_13_40_8]
MSRIGRRAIKIIPGVKVEKNERAIKVSGPKGDLVLELPRQIKFEEKGDEIVLSRISEDKKVKALHGLWRVLIANAITGVSAGWERKLDFKGVGFRAEVEGNKLILNVGFSHPVEITAPEGVSFEVNKNIITVSGIDKQVVGQVAANIRRVRPVEPYKQKGIKYLEEIPRKKLGKAAKAVVGTGA